MPTHHPPVELHLSSQQTVGNKGQNWMPNQGAEAQDTGGHKTTAPNALQIFSPGQLICLCISGPCALSTRMNYEDQRAALKDRRQTAPAFKMRKEHEHYKRTWTLQNVTKHSLLGLSSSLRKILEQIIKQMASAQTKMGDH